MTWLLLCNHHHTAVRRACADDLLTTAAQHCSRLAADLSEANISQALLALVGLWFSLGLSPYSKQELDQPLKDRAAGRMRQYQARQQQRRDEQLAQFEATGRVEVQRIIKLGFNTWWLPVVSVECVKQHSDLSVCLQRQDDGATTAAVPCELRAMGDLEGVSGPRFCYKRLSKLLSGWAVKAVTFTGMPLIKFEVQPPAGTDGADDAWAQAAELMDVRQAHLFPGVSGAVSTG